MKILRSIHTLNPAVGGPIESVRQSSVALVSRGHEVEIITLDAPSAPWLKDFPVPVHAAGPGRGSYGYTAGLTGWIAARRKQYDAVVVHGIWQYSSFGVWRALHDTSTPYFVFPHGMLDPWFKRIYPLKHIKKLLYWPWGEYRVLRDAAAVLFTSEEEKRLARHSFSPYHCREIVVNYGTAPPKVDLPAARADFFQAFPQLQGKRLLLFLGRLHEKKGCDLLLEAFAAAHRSQAGEPFHLVVAGPAANDTYLAKLKRLAIPSTGERPVTFPGMLGGHLKWGALSAADAFILPSHQENFGIAVVEALACSTPVLISNKVNIWREIVEDGAGFADEDDRDGTVRLIERWTAVPAAARETMRTSARKCFERRFHIDDATESLLQILAEPRRAS
jgi:glycosyltransferase involved in cell wall biosynthesis